MITDVDAALGQSVSDEGGFIFIEQDVAVEARWAEVVGEVQRKFGRLDLLVNNAGIVGPRDAVNPETVRLADWICMFAVNVNSVLLGCRAAIPAMRAADGGAIVNIASIAGLSATPSAMAYGATKATVLQMTRSIAQHCAEQGLAIRCNAVLPGNVHTAIWDREAAGVALRRGITPEKVLEEVGARNPMCAFVDADEVAAAVAYLCSFETRHMTGSELVIDAGSINCNTFHRSLRFRDAILRSAMTV